MLPHCGVKLRVFTSISYLVVCSLLCGAATAALWCSCSTLVTLVFDGIENPVSVVQEQLSPDDDATGGPRVAATRMRATRMRDGGPAGMVGGVRDRNKDLWKLLGVAAVAKPTS